MRLVVIGDSHGYHDHLEVPDGDVLIHAGDFCSWGTIRDVIRFKTWLVAQPHKHKVVVAGNHDVTFERDPITSRVVLGDACTYLQDQETVIAGVRFYGSPWQPYFCDWAFNLRRGEPLRAKWDLIPLDTDVLITHGPPYGILDLVPYDNEHVGCRELGKRITIVQPKVHIFGHIHEGYGHDRKGGIDYYNVSVCTGDYKPINPVTVIDI